MPTKSEEYRNKAREAETLAILACDPVVKRQFEEIARQWFRMAALAREHGW